MSIPPDQSLAYRYGCDAFRAGYRRSDNPYILATRSKLKTSWYSGFDQASYDAMAASLNKIPAESSQRNDLS